MKVSVLLAIRLLARSTLPWAERLAFWSRAELEDLRQRLSAIESELLRRALAGLNPPQVDGQPSRCSHGRPLA